MTKHVHLSCAAEARGHVQTLSIAARETCLRLRELAADMDGLPALSTMKFSAIGCDPLEPTRPLNLIEQLNQTFTYLASFFAAEWVFTEHKSVTSLELNLGTLRGWDLETADDGGIAAEIFAAVTPTNNRKLVKDIEKVAEAEASYRYVFFMCPGIPAGPYQVAQAKANVRVQSLGLAL